MDLAIVIVSYNAREPLRRCLEALPDGAGGLAWELVVVDNASDDGSAELVAEFPRARLLRNGENLGFARACNQGIRATGAPLVLFLNSDAEASPGSLAALVGFLAGQPRVGAVGPRLRRADGGPARSCFRFPSLTRPLLNLRLVRRFAGERFGLPYPPDDPRLRTGGPVDWLSGACLLVRRETLEAAGPFDERYFFFFEDADLCRRIWRAGWQVVFWPGAEVRHLGGASSRRLGDRLRVENQRSRLIYFATHHPGPVSLLVRSLAALAALVRALRWLALGRGGSLRDEARILRLILGGVAR